MNLLPFLNGENKARPHPTLYWRFGEQMAIHHGDLKLVKARGGGPTPELYDLAADISESKNLAAMQPERAQELHAKLVAWRAAVKAPMPTPNLNRGSASDTAPASAKKKKGGPPHSPAPPDARPASGAAR